MKTRKLKVDDDGLPVDQDLLNFDYKADPLAVMTKVNDALKAYGLEVVHLTEESDEYYFKIEAAAVKRPVVDPRNMHRTLR